MKICTLVLLIGSSILSSPVRAGYDPLTTFGQKVKLKLMVQSLPSEELTPAMPKTVLSSERPLTLNIGENWITVATRMRRTDEHTAGPMRQTINMTARTALDDIADARANSENSPQTVGNWVEIMRPHSASIAQSSSISAIGFIGHLAGTRTSDNGCTGGCQGAIAYAGFANNDNVKAGRLQTAYAGYFEGVRRAGAGTTHGIEVNTANFGDTVPMSPVNIGPVGITPGVWIAAGAGYSGTRDSSAAIGIIDNGARFAKGIVFSSTALTPRTDNKMEAISLASNQTISFYDVSGNVIGNIYGIDKRSGPDKVGIAFGGGTIVVENSAGTPVLTAGQSSVKISSLIIEPNTPASSKSKCTRGQLTTDANFVYVCTATNMWKRSALAGF